MYIYVLSARLRSSVAAFLLGNHTHLDPCWDTETEFKERIFLIEEALFREYYCKVLIYWKENINIFLLV